jgi:steroid 5-alpha reductase family enzyme
MAAGADSLAAVAACGLAAGLALAAAVWAASVALRKASIVDAFWPWLVVGPALVYFRQLLQAGHEPGLRGTGILLLAGAWALRLSLYVAWRNWGRPEDRRYEAIRKRNEPGFAFKSLYLVFGLQALLAWVVSMPLLAALAGGATPGWPDAAGAAVAAFGIAFEALADWQLARFKAGPRGPDDVMDRGLWRYTRHPNYFGECVAWWGFYLMAVAGGGAWSVVSPLLVTFLLLKVSGVTLLESDLAARKAGWRDYVARTNAFFPGPPRGGDGAR